MPDRGPAPTRRRSFIGCSAIGLGGFFLLLFVGLLASWPLYGHFSRKAFEDHVTHLEARGESLSIEELRPEAAGDPARNFAEAPAVAALLRSVRTAAPESTMEAVAPFAPSKIEGYTRSGRQDLVRYLESPEIEDCFPGLSREEAARSVLGHCEEIPELDDWIAALARPESDLGLQYEEGYALALPEVRPLRSLASLLQLRARAALAVEAPDIALESILAILRLSRHLGREPGLILVLVGAATQEMALPVIRDGIVDSTWSTSQLRQIRDALPSGSDWSSRFHESLRMERAVFVDQMMKLKDPEEIQRWAGSQTLDDLPAAGRAIPRGWLYDNARMFSTILQEEVFENDGSPLGESFEGRVMNLQTDPVRRYRFLLVSLAMPAYSELSTRILQTGIYGELADAALALEIARRESGAYPEDLAALASFSGTSPIDIWSGEPLRYRKMEDSYLLYSIGPNRVDDGGRLRRDRDAGDWSWRPELTKDFDRERYLE